jgi:DNA ligase-associated metallophosphoesterase
MRDHSLTIAGQDVRLLPERGLLIERTRTLIVADVHWGKSAAFRAARIPVPPGTTTSDLDRLSGLIARTAPARLDVLGDHFHARTWQALRTATAIRQWRHKHRELPISLVRGNHDLRAGDPPQEFAIECVDEPYRLGRFVLCHRPCHHDGGYTLAGHIHPCYSVYGPGRQRERLPCFLLGKDTGVIPAFGSFTGMAPVGVVPGDAVFVIAGDEVIEISQ